MKDKLSKKFIVYYITHLTERDNMKKTSKLNQ